MSRPNKHTLTTGIAVFIFLPLCIGVLLYTQMFSGLHSYMEEQAAAQTEILKQLASSRLSNRLEELERVAGYFKDGIVAEENMSASANRLLTADTASVGILRLTGEPVEGQALPASSYPAVQSAFRGRSAVRYRKGEGMLFTAPIYNGDNIKYALYEFIAEENLFQGFGDNCFQERAILMLADVEQGIAMPLTEEAILEDDPWFQRGEIQEAIEELSEQLNLSTSAAVYCRSGGERIFLCASELDQANLYLLAIVPYRVIAGEISALFLLVTLVFALLMALLVIGTIRIVTTDARARESDELRRAKQQAEDAYESKSRFLASMSHELRTPINTIMGMDEMILRETREQETRERAMDVKSAAQILMALINDVLDFSKIESGMLSILPAEYHLVTLIRDLTLLSENRARAKSLEFELDIQPELPEALMGDDLRLQQILTNLLTNAVKYTQKGTVTLRMSGSRKQGNGDALILHCEVEDTGMGIRPEDMERLMRQTPYTRVDQDRNRKVEGSGLGMPIIINLLRLMGSQLQARSVYGEGSLFWFDLEQRVMDEAPIGDIRERLASATQEYEYRVSCYAPRARVLVVDDNAMNRKIFCSLLKQTKIQVTAVSSGFKCLDLVRKERFDLIFMDHLMPELDGVETLRQLKEMDGNLCRNTPVVALTANAFSGAQEKYMELGFDAFLAKPIVTEKLEGLLMGMLPPEYLEQPPQDAALPAAEPARGEPELPEIEGVDWPCALSRVPDSGLLLDALRDFYQSLDGERRALAALMERLDGETALSDYRTRVHALKSTAAMVGILSVSELARLLEDAARAGDRERVRTLHPILLELLDKTEARLKPHVGQSGEKPRAEDRALLNTLLDLLRGALEDMDIEAADKRMAQINACSYDADLQASMDQLSALVSNLDFAGAAELVDQLLGGDGRSPAQGEA